MGNIQQERNIWEHRFPWKRQQARLCSQRGLMEPVSLRAAGSHHWGRHGAGRLLYLQLFPFKLHGSTCRLSPPPPPPARLYRSGDAESWPRSFPGSSPCLPPLFQARAALPASAGPRPCFSSVPVRLSGGRSGCGQAGQRWPSSHLGPRDRDRREGGVDLGGGRVQLPPLETRTAGPERLSNGPTVTQRGRHWASPPSFRVLLRPGRRGA